MDLGRYGPFANVVALASALIASFSILLLKALGSVRRWTWLTSGTPPFLVTAGARVLAVALMAVTYVTIDKSNYGWFGAAAVLSGALGFAAIAQFERLRRLHVCQIEDVDKHGKPIPKNVVVGLESELQTEAKEALEKQRKEKGGLSLRQFMSGYGAQKLNDPENLWDSALLARIASKLTTNLMYVVLLGVMALFWAAFTIEAASR